MNFKMTNIWLWINFITSTSTSPFEPKLLIENVEIEGEGKSFWIYFLVDLVLNLTEVYDEFATFRVKNQIEHFL